MNRRVIGWTILAVWLVALGLLMQRQLRLGGTALLADRPLNISPTATYYRLMLGDQVIGFASNLVDTLPDTLRVEDLLVLRVPVRDSTQHIEARGEAFLTRTLGLRRFTARLRGPETAFEARGTVSGDSLLTLEIESAGAQQRITVPLSRPIVLPSLVPLRMAFGHAMQVGQSYTVPLFDPLLLEERSLRIDVTAESTMVVVDSAGVGPDSVWMPARWDTVRAWQLRASGGDLPQEMWIDDLGRLVWARTPMEFRMERTAFEIAYQNFQRLPPLTERALGDVDLVRQTAIAAEGAGAQPLEARPFDELRVRLTGVDIADLNMSDGRQRVAGDTLIIRRESGDALRATYRLPATTSSMASYLESEPLIQADDPRIQAQARTIAGRIRNPARVAELLNQWVHDELAKEPTLGVPSATEVLERRRGDCNEHTVLFVALARAVGLPARTAAGLVYLRGRFYYHAWPEVWFGDHWVALDPTLGQFPADAAHLRFTIGGLARQVELLTLIGRLQLDVVEAKPLS